MKLQLTIFFFIICTNICFSQEKGSSIRKSYSGSGKLESITYRKNYRTYKISYFDANQNLVSEREYLDQKGNQIATFFEKGKLKSRYTYKGPHANGKAIQYNDSGGIKSIGYFENGLKIGVWTWFDGYGKKSAVSYYENNKSQIDSVFQKDGTFVSLVKHIYYQKGVEKRIFYNKESNKYQESFFRNEALHGKSIFFYKNGKTKFVGEYRKGRMFGERLYYNENGDLINGDFVAYNDSGYIEREGKCINGKPEGEFRVYDFNNNLGIKAQFKNGKAEGETYYYEGGDKIILTEIYKNGKFKRE